MAWDWKYYTGNLTWLKDRTIYMCRAGSHAYGTNIVSSDEDYRGIAVPPAPYLYGFLNRFEQAEMGPSKSGGKDKVDCVIYEIRKYFTLAAECNPNILELLYTDPEDQVFVHPIMQQLLDNRHLFLSKQAKHTFSGYAHSQLQRIKGHRRWLEKPPAAPPQRSTFGLPDMPTIPPDQRQAAESLVRKKLVELESPIDWQVMEEPIRYVVQESFRNSLKEVAGAKTAEELWRTVGVGLGMSTNFLDIVEKERQYKTACDEWKQYQTWKKERNVERAALEAKFQYDTKHAMHLYRLLSCCLEILLHGTLTVRRPDAKKLLRIRNGDLTYNELIEDADRMLAEIEVAYAASTLPRAPNRVAIDWLCIDMVGNALQEFGP